MSTQTDSNKVNNISPELRQYLEAQQDLQILQDPARLNLSQYYPKNEQSTQTVNSIDNPNQPTNGSVVGQNNNLDRRQQFREMIREKKREFYEKYQSQFQRENQNVGESTASTNNTNNASNKQSDDQTCRFCAYHNGNHDNHHHRHHHHNHCHHHHHRRNCQFTSQGNVDQQNNQNNGTLNNAQSTDQTSNTQMNNNQQSHQFRGFCPLSRYQEDSKNNQLMNTQNNFNQQNGFNMNQQTPGCSNSFFQNRWNAGDHHHHHHCGHHLPFIFATGVAIFLGIKFTRRAFCYMRAQPQSSKFCWWKHKQ